MLNRTTRRIAHTEAGQRYLLRCEQILAYVEEAEAEASDAHARPAGKLKLHSMTGIGQHYVIRAIAGYRQQYRDVTFDLTMANRVPDLLDGASTWPSWWPPRLPDSGFISQRIGETYSILCASPEYLRLNGTPSEPSGWPATTACAWSARWCRWIAGCSTVPTAGKWSPSAPRRSRSMSATP